MSAKSLLLYFTLLVFFALGLQASAETDVLDGMFFDVSLCFTMNQYLDQLETFSQDSQISKKCRISSPSRYINDIVVFAGTS